MLSIFFFFFFLLFILTKKNYWMFQNLIFCLIFKLLLLECPSGFYGLISYGYGCDLISYWFILLSIWISSLMFMASEKIYREDDNTLLFSFMTLFLLLLLILVFSSLNLMMFYLFFESSLIPTMMLIFGWGYQPERIRAGIYLLFYTLFGSYPFFVSILYLYYLYNSLFFGLLNLFKLNFSVLFCLSIMVAFFMKIPMYLLHLWLPKAHVQAPVSGSMILAGVLLKLGGYGLYRAYPLINKFAVNFNFIWITLNLIGGILVSLNCLRLLDMKSLVAYSSVSHMGVMLCGLLSFTCWGLNGSYLFMIGHGLCSSCLFLLVNISYERLGSRSLILNKGLLNFMPSMGIWWFLICVGNMGCPPSLNLMGEIFLINGIMSWSTYSFLGLSLISLLGAAFCLYLYSSCQHGKSNQLMNYYSSGSLREYLTLFLHWIPFNLLILLSDQLMIF